MDKKQIGAFFPGSEFSMQKTRPEGGIPDGFACVYEKTFSSL